MLQTRLQKYNAAQIVMTWHRGKKCVALVGYLYYETPMVHGLAADKNEN